MSVRRIYFNDEERVTLQFMETINELARETPIIHRTEVLVVGSGPGGLAAAIASARLILFIQKSERSRNYENLFDA